MRKLLIVCLSFIMALQFPMTAISQDNDTYLSEEIQQYCIEIGEEYGICPELLMAIIETESRGQADADNGKCKGLMQIYVYWHQDRMERLGVTDIFDEYSNILVGADLLSDLRDTYGDVATVLMDYHGESNVRSKAANGEISDYARNILERSTELEETHYGNNDEIICSFG